MKDERQAFPQLCSDMFHTDSKGMSLRQYYASSAMQGLLAFGWASNLVQNESFKIADAMIREGEK